MLQMLEEVRLGMMGFEHPAMVMLNILVLFTYRRSDSLIS